MVLSPNQLTTHAQSNVQQITTLTQRSAWANVQRGPQCTKTTQHGHVSTNVQWCQIIIQTRIIRNVWKIVRPIRLPIGIREAVWLLSTAVALLWLILWRSAVWLNARKPPCTMSLLPPTCVDLSVAVGCLPSMTPTSVLMHVQLLTSASTPQSTFTAFNTVQRLKWNSLTKHPTSAFVSVHAPMGISSLVQAWNAWNFVQMGTGETLQTINAFKTVLHYTQMIPPTCAWLIALMALLLITIRILAKVSASMVNSWKTKCVWQPAQLDISLITWPDPVFKHALPILSLLPIL